MTKIAKFTKKGTEALGKAGEANYERAGG